MKRYFNNTKMEEIKALYTGWNIEITNEDIYGKRLIKKLNKAIKDIHYINYVFNFTSNKEELIGKFFPLKLADVKEHGDYRTLGFFYDEVQGKIVWRVDQNGNERVMKLKTDLYAKRTKDERALIAAAFKKQTDKLYGYWLTDDGYVTDGNFENGVYKRIGMNPSDGHILP